MSRPSTTSTSVRRDRTGRPEAAGVGGAKREPEPEAGRSAELAAKPPEELGLLFVPKRAGQVVHPAVFAGQRSFPSAELVGAAAALFDQAEPWATGTDRSRKPEPEGARFFVQVSPGGVRLIAQDAARAARATERHAHRREIEVRAREGELRIDSEFSSAPLSGRAVTEWSRKSRATMVRTLAELDYSPMLSDSSRVPAMVTLTYPGDWVTVAPNGAAVKDHLKRFRKRYERAWNERACYLWKLEFQKRGAPHIHLWMVPPHGTASTTGEAFRPWLSRTWADIVAHPDPEQRRRHELAGTAVDFLEGLKARDPKRLAIYFAKHNAAGPGEKEYQHIVPKEWREPGKGPGRFWGHYGIEKKLATVEIPMEDFITARRILRRWSRSQTSYGSGRWPSAVRPRAARVRVARVDRRTGRVRWRWATRRRPLLASSALVGGFALTASGTGLASALARALMAG